MYNINNSDTRMTLIIIFLVNLLFTLRTYSSIQSAFIVLVVLFTRLSLSDLWNWYPSALSSVYLQRTRKIGSSEFFLIFGTKLEDTIVERITRSERTQNDPSFSWIRVFKELVHQAFLFFKKNQKELVMKMDRAFFLWGKIWMTPKWLINGPK